MDPLSPHLRTRRWPGMVALAGLLLALPLAITPSYLADTFRYAVEVAAHQEGRPSPFWEFGHLLWRPWGALGLALCGGWFRQAFGDDAVRAVARFLIATSWLSAAAALLLFLQLARRTAGRWAAWAAAAPLAATQAMGN